MTGPENTTFLLMAFTCISHVENFVMLHFHWLPIFQFSRRAKIDRAKSKNRKRLGRRQICGRAVARASCSSGTALLSKANRKNYGYSRTEPISSRCEQKKIALNFFLVHNFFDSSIKYRIFQQTKEKGPSNAKMMRRDLLRCTKP